MVPYTADKRPPFVRFEEREMGFNHEASELAGRPIPRVVTLACITPHGSKDSFEKIAEDWLVEIRAKALKNEYPLEWARFFREAYDEWKKGNELPREGTPTRTWAAVTKEQSVRLCALGYTTIEDVAQIPDGSLGQVGPDGRYLRDLAAKWIQEGKDKGINAKELADANAKIAALEQTQQDLRGVIQELRDEIKALRDEREPAPSGKRRKAATTAADE